MVGHQASKNAASTFAQTGRSGVFFLSYISAFDTRLSPMLDKTMRYEVVLFVRFLLHHRSDGIVVCVYCKGSRLTSVQRPPWSEQPRSPTSGSNWDEFDSICLLAAGDGW